MSTPTPSPQASPTPLAEVLSTIRSTVPPVERGPSDCAIVRLLDFRPEVGSKPGCCPGLDELDARCDFRNGRVTFIGVSEQETRTIPESIGELDELRMLWAHSNHATLTGPLPQSMAKLSKITQINVENNQLTGQLPDIFHDKRLEYLMLANNNFTGRIPLLPPIQCVLLRGPSDSNRFTCAEGDPRQHIGSCYQNLRANGIPPCTPLPSSAPSTPIVLSGPIEGDATNAAAPVSALVIVFLSVSATLLTVVAIISVIMCYQRRRENRDDWELESAVGSWASEDEQERLDHGTDVGQLLRPGDVEPVSGAEYPVTMGVQPPLPRPPSADPLGAGELRGRQCERARIEMAIPLVTKKDMMMRGPEQDE
ncbi:hypothetical protein BCR44DRAFT_72650 [Catenaria anguillulae PL171]|uniref:Uncharacterized protein n=1 Tax=Catenaria anguillulae PL171 TaxID=765915 RepID=A0A1Y2HVJ5_9FUNG|nr:hypothetical protein BCR44DRAFT_72650 [Catenaria anguillulae PL171]